jgi:hypothetical protein
MIPAMVLKHIEEPTGKRIAQSLILLQALQLAEAVNSRPWSQGIN